MIKLSHMALNGVNRVYNDKIRSNDLERRSIGYTMIKSSQMVLKGINWVYSDKIGSNGLEISQLGTQ